MSKFAAMNMHAILVIISLGYSNGLPPYPQIPGPPGDIHHYHSLAPKFAPRWRMNESTIIMPCDVHGFNATEAAAWGIADFDYSNSKAAWSVHKPMDCQARLVTQAKMTKAKNERTKVWVYRNIVTAMPWFKDVANKLNDPAYHGWFLHFKPGYTENGTNLFHDWKPNAVYGQAPNANCGGIPCAEYLWNHRNESARQYIVETIIGGADAMGSEFIDGIFLDDFWTNFPYSLPWASDDCSRSSVGGPSETLGGCIQQIGLSAADVQLMATSWQITLNASLRKIVDLGGYAWQMLQMPDFGEGNHDGPPMRTTPRNASFFRRECSPNSLSQSSPIILQFTSSSTRPLPSLEQDVAAFLLIRTEYAWLGYSWLGCAIKYLDPRGTLLDKDYGEPLDARCVESSDGVFTRRWSKATISLDTNTNQASIIFKSP